MKEIFDSERRSEKDSWTSGEKIHLSGIPTLSGHIIPACYLSEVHRFPHRNIESY